MVAPAPVYVGDNTVLLLTRYSRKMYVDSRDTSIAAHLIMGGDWETEESKVIMRVLRGAPSEPTQLFIDVGANVGWHSLVAYFAREGRIQVRAYEPNPRFAKMLRKTFLVNGMWHGNAVVCAAVSNRSGTADLAFDPDCTGASFVLGADDELVPPGFLPPSLDFKRQPVRLVTLDEELTGCDTPVGMIKIDTEGHEEQVIEGARETIRRWTDVRLLVEHQPDESHRRMMEWLFAEGFRACWLEDKREPESLTIEGAMAKGLGNVYYERKP